MSNICIAKQTLFTCNEYGRSTYNSNYKDYMKDGGKVIGNVRALNSYRFKIINSEEQGELEYLIQDDIFMINPDLAMMCMDIKCFNKYFVIVEGDGREEDE